MYVSTRSKLNLEHTIVRLVRRRRAFSHRRAKVFEPQSFGRYELSEFRNHSSWTARINDRLGGKLSQEVPKRVFGFGRAIDDTHTIAEQSKTFGEQLTSSTTLEVKERERLALRSQVLGHGKDGRDTDTAGDQQITWGGLKRESSFGSRHPHLDADPKAAVSEFGSSGAR